MFHFKMKTECCETKVYIVCGKEIYDPEIHNIQYKMPASKTCYYFCKSCHKSCDIIERKK